MTPSPAEVLAAADVVEAMSRLYSVKTPSEGLWSAAQLRYEAKHLGESDE